MPKVERENRAEAVESVSRKLFHDVDIGAQVEDIREPIDTEYDSFNGEDFWSLPSIYFRATEYHEYPSPSWSVVLRLLQSFEAFHLRFQRIVSESESRLRMLEHRLRMQEHEHRLLMLEHRLLMLSLLNGEEKLCYDHKAEKKAKKDRKLTDTLWRAKQKNMKRVEFKVCKNNNKRFKQKRH